MKTFILMCRKARRDYPNLWEHRRADRKIIVAYWLPSVGLVQLGNFGVLHRLMWNKDLTLKES